MGGLLTILSEALRLKIRLIAEVKMFICQFLNGRLRNFEIAVELLLSLINLQAFFKSKNPSCKLIISA